jgi:ABC-type sugar transport system substrate-binding protein
MLRVLAAIAVAALAVGLAACGSDSGSSSGSSSGTETSGGGGGSEQSSFTYGYSIPSSQNPWQMAIAETAQSVADEGGGEGELADAQLELSTAVTQVNRFITNGDEAVVAAPPMVPEAMQAIFGKAVDAGAAMLAMEWSFAPGEATAAPKSPVQGQVNMDREKLGIEVAEAINEGDPAGAKVIYIGLPFPVVGVDFFQEVMEEHLGKSEIISNIDNPSDNAQGALGPLNGALAANPDATAIVTYNGPSALAAIQSVKSAGLIGKVDIYNIQLETATAKALKEGKLTACWDDNPIEVGEALGELMVDAGTGKPESGWAKTVVVAPKKYTQENIGSWVDWAPGA